jgi:DNA-binding NarL/FixJ family response regulator
VDSELFVDCLRTIAKGEPWLEPHAVKWVLEAYRAHGTRPHGARSKVQLTPKESLIVSCVTQGMKNKEIAVRVGTTEQVVKNYLRKVYDKLGVTDRLELALYCLNNRVLLDAKPVAPAEAAKSTTAPMTTTPESTEDSLASTSEAADIKKPS